MDVVRGKKLPLKIKKGANSQQVLDAAIQKRKAHDRTFRSDRFYTLNYPDGSKVVKIPGTNEAFTLVKYEEELGKGYSRTTLFLCYKPIKLDSPACEIVDLDDDYDLFDPQLPASLPEDIFALESSDSSCNTNKYSGTPPYGHLVNTVTSLTRPLFLSGQNVNTFPHKNTPLIRSQR